MNLNNFGVSFADTSIFSSDSEYGSDLDFLPYVQDLDFDFGNTSKRVGEIGSKKGLNVSSNEIPDVKLKISTIETFDGLFSDFFVDGQLSQNLNSDRNFYLLHGYHPQRREVDDSCEAANEPVELIYSTSPATYIAYNSGDDVIKYPETSISDLDFSLTIDRGPKVPQRVSIVGNFEYQEDEICILYEESGAKPFKADYIKEITPYRTPSIKVYTETPYEYLNCYINFEKPEDEFIDLLSASEPDQYTTIYKEYPSGYAVCIIDSDHVIQEIELTKINLPKSFDAPNTRNYELLSLTSAPTNFYKHQNIDFIGQAAEEKNEISFIKGDKSFIPEIIIKHLFVKNYFNFTQEVEADISIEGFESIDVIDDLIEEEDTNRINYVGTSQTYLAMETKRFNDLFVSKGFEAFFHYKGLTGYIELSEPRYQAKNSRFFTIDFEEANIKSDFSYKSGEPLLADYYQDFENETAVELSLGGAIEIQDFEAINHYDGLTGIYDESLDGTSIVTKSTIYIDFYFDYFEDFENVTTEQIRDLQVGCHEKRVDYQDFQYTEFENPKFMRPYIPLKEKDIILSPVVFSNFEAINHYDGLTGIYDESFAGTSIVTKIPKLFSTNGFESLNTDEIKDFQLFSNPFKVDSQDFQYDEFRAANFMRDLIPLDEMNLVSKPTEIMMQNFESVDHYKGLTGEYTEEFKSVSISIIENYNNLGSDFEHLETGLNEELLCLIPIGNFIIPKTYYDFENSVDQLPALEDIYGNNLTSTILNFNGFEANNLFENYKLITSVEKIKIGIEDFENINEFKWDYTVLSQYITYLFNIEDFESTIIKNIYTTPSPGFRQPPPWPNRRYANSICFGNAFLDSIKIKQSYNGVMSSEYSYTSLNMIAQENESVKVGNSQYFSTGLMPSINLTGDQKPVGNFSINNLNSYHPEFGDATQFMPGSRTHLIINGVNSNQSFLIKPNNIQSFDLDLQLNRESIKSVNKKFAVACIPVGPFLGKLSVNNIFSDLEYGDASNLHRALKTDEEYNVIISGKRFNDSDFQINISKAQLKSKSFNGSLSQSFDEKIDFTFGMNNVTLTL
jgi:hypothetical protein